MNPEAPREGVNKLEYYYKKFGKARVESMVPAMTKNFADVGVEYSMGGMTGSTVDSHRLATWTKEKYGLEKQNEVMTQMFQAYFSVCLLGIASACRCSPCASLTAHVARWVCRNLNRTKSTWATAMCSWQRQRQRGSRQMMRERCSRMNRLTLQKSSRNSRWRSSCKCLGFRFLCSTHQQVCKGDPSA